MMQQSIIDIATGNEELKAPRQLTDEDIHDLLKEVPADPVPKDLAEPAKVKEVEQNDLVCSGCLWTARMVRTTLAEKMPKSPKDPQQRYELGLEAMRAEGKEDVCSSRRLPEVIVLGDRRQVRDCKGGSGRLCRIVDLFEARKRATGAGLGFAPNGIEKMLKSRAVARNEIMRICDAVKKELAEAVADKAKAFKGTRMWNAVSDEWLCTKAMNACPEEDLPMGQRTVQEEDEEL